MEFNERFLNFFESEDERRTFEYKRGKKYTLTKHDLDDGLFALYCTTKKDDDPFSNYETKYLATLEKDTFEMVHCDYSNLLYAPEKIYTGESYEEMGKYNNLERDLRSEIEDLLSTILENGKDIYYKRTDLSKYEKQIKEYYTQKKTMTFPEWMVVFHLDFDKICEYHKNPKKFIYKQAKLHLTENNIERYKEYLALTIGLAEYADRIENNDEGKIKKSLLEIMSNDKYKNIKITFKYPDGSDGYSEYSKNNHYIVSSKGDIFDKNKIENIPIYAIETVTWGRSVLYNKSDVVSDKFVYKEENQIEDFIKLSHKSHLPNWVYSDRKYIDDLLEAFDYYAFDVIDKSLLEDKEFLKESIEKHNLSAGSVLNYLKSEKLSKDKDFILYVIDKSLGNDQPRYTRKNNALSIAKNTDESLRDDLDVAKKLFDAADDIEVDFLNQFSDEIVSNQEIIDIMKTKDLHKINQFVGRFKTTDALFTLFTKEQLQESIYNIDYKLLVDDKALVLTLLDDMTKEQSQRLFSNDDNNFIYDYRNDEDVMDRVCKVISGVRPIKQLAEIMGIKYPDDDAIRVYELASNNVEFLTLFSNNKLSEIYFSGEAGEATKVLDFDETSSTVTLQAAYGTFKVNAARYSRPQIYFKDNNNHQLKVTFDAVEKILFENVKELCGDTKSTSLYEAIWENKEKLSSLVSKDLEIEER